MCEPGHQTADAAEAVDADLDLLLAAAGCLRHGGGLVCDNGAGLHGRIPSDWLCPLALHPQRRSHQSGLLSECMRADLPWRKLR